MRMHHSLASNYSNDSLSAWCLLTWFLAPVYQHVVGRHLRGVWLEPSHEVGVLRVHPDWGAEIGLRLAWLSFGHEERELLNFNILKVKEVRTNLDY